MCCKNIAGRFVGLVTKHACDGQTDRQNYDSQDRASIVSRGKTRYTNPSNDTVLLLQDCLRGLLLCSGICESSGMRLQLPGVKNLYQGFNCKLYAVYKYVYLNKFYSLERFVRTIAASLM